MQLPDPILQLIFGCGNFRHDKNETEKRRAARVPLSRKTTLCRYAFGTMGPSINVRVREMSATGAGILVPEPMTAGEEFVLLVPKSTDGAIPVLCTTTRCERGGGFYVVGATFKQLFQMPPNAAPASQRPATVLRK